MSLPPKTELSNQVPWVDGATRVFGVIAHPVDHVRAPMVFNPRFASAGLPHVMVPRQHAETTRSDEPSLRCSTLTAGSGGSSAAGGDKAATNSILDARPTREGSTPRFVY